MAYITTNTDVACTITVTKKVVGQLLSGYPKTYSILDAFAAQPAITERAWQKMPYTQQSARITAFKSHINGLEGMDIDATQTNDVFRDSAATPGVIVEEGD
jgi:hypothetical protein